MLVQEIVDEVEVVEVEIDETVVQTDEMLLPVEVEVEVVDVMLVVEVFDDAD